MIKREFDPNLAPGTEKVVKKVTRNKTITTPTTKNPLTGEKVGERTNRKITKQPVDEIVHYGGEKIPQAIKMNLIQMHRKVVKKTFQVNQELKILIQAK